LISPAHTMATSKEVVVPKERLCDRVSEAPLIGRLDGEDMLKMAMERTGIAEPPVMPIEATAGLAMLLWRRSATGRRSADCSSATPTEARATPMA
jgi:hypothetical protein